MCSQWLLRRAPLSLRWYTGPLFSTEIEAAEERYLDVKNLLGCFPISLNLQPLEHIECVNNDVVYA